MSDQAAVKEAGHPEYVLVGKTRKADPDFTPRPGFEMEPEDLDRSDIEELKAAKTTTLDSVVGYLPIWLDGKLCAVKPPKFKALREFERREAIWLEVMRRVREKVEPAPTVGDQIDASVYMVKPLLRRSNPTPISLEAFEELGKLADDLMDRGKLEISEQISDLVLSLRWGVGETEPYREMSGDEIEELIDLDDAYRIRDKAFPKVTAAQMAQSGGLPLPKVENTPSTGVS